MNRKLIAVTGSGWYADRVYVCWVPEKPGVTSGADQVAEFYGAEAWEHALVFIQAMQAKGWASV